MIMRQYGKTLRPFVLLIMLLTAGCARQMKTVQPDAVPEARVNAELKSITVADDASRIDILSDKPIVYTYYMLESPPRLVVDLAQTTSGTLVLPIEVSRGRITRIDVAKHEFGNGVLSRVEVLLAEKVEVSAALDQQDKNRLVLKLEPPLPPAPAEPVPAIVPAAAPAAVTPVTETVQVIDPAPVTGEGRSSGSGEQGTAIAAKAEAAIKDQGAATENAAPAIPAVVAVPARITLKPGERGLTAIIKNEDSIQLEIGGGVESFKVFRLNQPERLVIDIPKTRSALAAKSVDINGFNLGKARVGGSPDKLRIVFDAVGTAIPPYTVTRNGAGLLIAFGEAQKKSAAVQQAAAETTPVEPSATASTTAVAQADPLPAALPAAAPAPAAEVVVTETRKETDPPPAAATRPVQVASTPAAPANPVPAPAKTAVNKSLPGTVEAVEFSQTEGISRITVRTSGNCTARQPVKTNKGYSLTLKDCRLPLNQQRQLDTKGFASAIKNIAPFSIKSKTAETRIAVNLRGTLPNSLKRDGDTLQWEFTEPANISRTAKSAKAPKAASALSASPADAFDRELPEAKQEPTQSKADKAMEDGFAMGKTSPPVVRHGKVYTGRKVTLEFSDADIKKIFQLLAEVSNQNFLISDEVTGTISLKLVNVPWDQALDVILENKNLGMQREGNIVQIRPKTKMKSLDDEALEMQVIEEKRLPQATVIFDINFATLSDIDFQFKAFKRLRTDWSVTSDIRTNKIIVVDTERNIKRMRALLESLDVPERQVMIEARIVQASSDFTRDIGVKWNFGYQDGSASVANINNIAGSMGGVVTTGLDGNAGGIATGISFGKLLSNIQLDMRLSASASINQIKIISTPKVMTVNNKPAKISQGQMIPYQNTTSTDGAKTEFIEAALSLEVTPHITADGSVSMKIKASNNSAGAGSPAVINKKEATTELVVKNGETTVIGGIYEDRDTDAETGVPYISEIPLLGWLFKSNQKNKTKNELLIFITPKIIN